MLDNNALFAGNRHHAKSFRVQSEEDSHFFPRFSTTSVITLQPIKDDLGIHLLAYWHILGPEDGDGAVIDGCNEMKTDTRRSHLQSPVLTLPD